MLVWFSRSRVRKREGKEGEYCPSSSKMTMSEPRVPVPHDELKASVSFIGPVFKVLDRFRQGVQGIWCHRLHTHRITGRSDKTHGIDPRSKARGSERKAQSQY